MALSYIKPAIIVSADKIWNSLPRHRRLDEQTVQNIVQKLNRRYPSWNVIFKQTQETTQYKGLLI